MMEFPLLHLYTEEYRTLHELDEQRETFELLSPLQSPGLDSVPRRALVSLNEGLLLLLLHV